MDKHTQPTSEQKRSLDSNDIAVKLERANELAERVIAEMIEERSFFTRFNKK